MEGKWMEDKTKINDVNFSEKSWEESYNNFLTGRPLKTLESSYDFNIAQCASNPAIVQWTQTHSTLKVDFLQHWKQID